MQDQEFAIHHSEPKAPDGQFTIPNSFLSNLLLFTDTLRQAGISISLNQTFDLTQALELVDLGQRAQVYHAARCILINRKEDLALFDKIFDLFWRSPRSEETGPQKAPLAPRHDPPKRQRLNIATLMAERARKDAPEVDLADKAGSFSASEILQTKEFSRLTSTELATIKRLIQAMRWRVSLRQTRRHIPDPQGQVLHLRRVMRSTVKHGGVPLRLTWKSRKFKIRPVVILADISGSMERYSRLLLQFAYSVSRGLGQVECFVFGTRLTRITPQLRTKNIDRALNEVAETVFDWSGGTRIGDSLATFNQEWSKRVLRRGAIVLIISDGWERGDVSTLRREMRYLQHRCYRLIWLNPLLGQSDYQPMVEGMAAALPFIDDFLPIHNLQSLEVLAEHLAQLD
jgi:uncharacterized protein with von Willebrand factor type A (vWA) domain